MKRSDFSSRDEYLKDLVVQAMMDDYESFDIIVTCAKEFASEEGESITEGEIRTCLKALIESGRVDAYDLHISQKDPVLFIDERLQELWYYPTRHERVAHMKRHNIPS